MKKILFLSVVLTVMIASLALTGVAFAQDPLPPPPVPGDLGGPVVPPVPPAPIPPYTVAPPPQQQPPNYYYSWCQWYPKYCTEYYGNYGKYQTYYKNYFGKGGIWYSKPWNYYRSGYRLMVWDDDLYYVYGTKVYAPAPYYASTQPPAQTETYTTTTTTTTTTQPPAQTETYTATTATEPAYNQWTVAMLGSMAKALNMTLDEFKKEIAAGKKPAELAAAKGMSADQFREAWQKELNLQMATEVTAGKLDQGLATKIFTYLKTKWNSW